METLSDNMLVASALGIPTTIAGASASSLAIDTKDFDNAAFVLSLDKALGGAPTLDLDIEAASDVGFGDAEIVKSADGIVVAGPEIVVVNVQADDLPEGKPFVRVTLIETGTGTLHALVCKAGFNPRKKFENMLGANRVVNTWE